MSTSSYIHIFHSDVSLRMHREAVRKAVDIFKEIYPDKTMLAEYFEKRLMNNNFFVFVNHNYENIKDESFIVLEFAKILAYKYDGWAIVIFNTDYEGLGDYLISVDYGIVELKIDGSFKKYMSYIEAKADFLRSQRRLVEVEKELGNDG